MALARTQAALERVHDEAKLDSHGLIEVVRDVIHSVSAQITAGNLSVFGELAPVFWRTLAAFAADDGTAALDPFVATL